MFQVQTRYTTEGYGGEVDNGTPRFLGIPKHLLIYQVIFGLPKSFSGTKSCFTKNYSQKNPAKPDDNFGDHHIFKGNFQPVAQPWTLLSLPLHLPDNLPGGNFHNDESYDENHYESYDESYDDESYDDESQDESYDDENYYDDDASFSRQEEKHRR